MENFFNYITQPLEYSEVDIWFKTNNIVFEKMDLFYDFTFTLVTILYDTYLGGSNEEKESKIERKIIYKNVFDKVFFNFNFLVGKIRK